MKKNNFDIYIIINYLIKYLVSHPYLSCFYLCLLINIFYFCSNTISYTSFLVIEIILSFLLVFIPLHHLCNNPKIKKNHRIIIFLILLIMMIFSTIMYLKNLSSGLWLFFGGIFILTWLCFCFKKMITKNQLILILILGISFLLKFYYIFHITINIHQHDVMSFGGGAGHAGYIEYILNNWNIPNFDVRYIWQFAHPPFHHIISAIWMFINKNIFNTDYKFICESLQTLSLFYSMIISINSYKIFKYLKLKGISLYIPLLIICFHPTFLFLSGSINNDALSLAFITGTLLYTLRWYDNQKNSEIIKLALCIGLGMMTKMSVSLVSIPVALIFLIALIKKNNKTKRILQYILFLFICAPLGLWFGIKNYIKYEIPLNYVHPVDESLPIYIEQDYNKRIFIFSEDQINDVFLQQKWSDENDNVVGKNDTNPIIVLLKTSMFEEFVNINYFLDNSYFVGISKCLFWINTLIALIGLICMLLFSIMKTNITFIQKSLFILFYFILMISFYKFAHDYTFVCSMNIRYITPTILIGSLFYGVFIDYLKKKNTIYSNIIYKLLCLIVILFVIAVIMLYLKVGLSVYNVSYLIL